MSPDFSISLYLFKTFLDVLVDFMAELLDTVIKMFSMWLLT